jgi:trimeric autotransporter adhesin
MNFRFAIVILSLSPLLGFAQGRWYPEGNACLANIIDTAVAGFYNDTVNNRLYVGGRFDVIGGVPANHIAYWDGTNWNAMGTGIDTSGIVGVGAICEYNGDIYVTGTFRSFNDVIYNNMARWNGSAWLPVGGGLHGGPVPTVADMCVYNGLLYVVGRFDSAGTTAAGGVAAWDGTNWHSLGDSPVSISWPQTCIVYDSTLIMGGVFAAIDTGNGFLSAPRIAGWNAYTNQWTTYGNIGGPINDLVEFHGEIYAGGSFQNTNGNNVSRWNGNNWNAVGTGVDNYVRTLCVYNDSLVAGGGFRHAGPLTVNFIAMWDGSSWNNLDSGFSTPLAFLPDVLGCIQFEDRLYAGGFFSYAGATKCSKLAVWPHSPLSVESGEQVDFEITIFPNPFNQDVTVVYTLTQTEDVEVRLMDCSGRVISVLQSSSTQAAGTHEATFNRSSMGLSSGIYLVEILIGEERIVEKVICE